MFSGQISAKQPIHFPVKLQHRGLVWQTSRLAIYCHCPFPLIKGESVIVRIVRVAQNTPLCRAWYAQERGGKCSCTPRCTQRRTLTSDEDREAAQLAVERLRLDETTEPSTVRR